MNKVLRHPAFIILLGLLAAAIAGLVLTSEWTQPSLRRGPGFRRTVAPKPLVDQSPLTTAQNLATLAVTPREKWFAGEAIRLGDQEVDVAFASALRHAARQSATLTPEARQIGARIKQANDQVQALQQEVTRLTKLASVARDDRKEELTAQVQLAQARLDLAQDDLDDARRDLARAGGDEQSSLKREFDEHEKGQSHADAAAAANTAAGQPASGFFSPRSLIAEISGWDTLRTELHQLLQAEQDCQKLATDLAKTHDSIEAELKLPESQNIPAAQPGTIPVAPAAGHGRALPVSTAVDELRTKQQDLSDFDKRIDAGQKLADLYAKWAALVWNRELRAVHRMIWSGLWILSIVLLTVVGESLASRFYPDLSADRKRIQTMGYVIRFAIRAVSFLLILFVVFGPPSQLATIIALAGAGLTVALKDFIVGFFGWFVLMGRNGVRPGDWVEINGVQGKVTDVGLLHTVLLETGNWTAAGHPTGRKVTFVNSYAIEGHYFNFSTAGQWLWDEIHVGLPAVRDPYPVVEAIQKIVLAATESTARLAEQEWQRASATWGLHSVSASPEVIVKPTDTGVDVIVRYVTRADERVLLRSRLYREVFEYLARKNVLPPEALPQQ